MWPAPHMEAREVVKRRAGRKRKIRDRKPCGRLKPEKHPDDKKRASRQPHRRALKDEDRMSEKAESTLGRLSLQDVISNAHYEAGELYARVTGRYRSVIDSPHAIGGFGRSLPSGDSEAADATEVEAHEQHGRCGAEGADPIERQVRIGTIVVTVRVWPCGLTDEGCFCAQRKTRYDAAFEALMRVGQRAAKAVARVAVHGEAIAPQDLVYLKTGLDALAKHFGLTGGRKREHVRNAH